MFRFHNSIKLEYDGQASIAANEVLDFKEVLDPEKAYAAFIVSGNCRENAELVGINSDITQGVLFAEYEAVFDKSEYDGIEFSEFSLVDESLKRVNIATFEPIVKETGKQVKVGITIYLELQGESSFLAGGDNPLVRFFLGARDLKGAVGVVSSTSNMRTQNVALQINPQSIRLATMTFFSGTVEFSAVSPVSEPEVVFTLESLPIIRVYAHEKNLKVRVGMSQVKDDFTFKIDYADVEEVVSVSQNGNSVYGGQLYHSFNKLFKTKMLGELELPYNTIFKSEPFERYCVAGNDKEVFLFEAENGKPSLLYRMPMEQYTDFEVCIDGCLVLFGENVFIRYKDGRTVTYSIKRGEVNYIFNEGTQFFYLNYSPNSRIINTYSLMPDGSYNHIISAEATTQIEAFKGFFGVYLLSCGNTGAFIKSSSATLSNPAAIVSECEWATKVLAISGLVYIKNATGDLIVTEDGGSYTLENPVDVFIAGEYLVLSEHDGVYLMCFDRAQRLPVKIELEGFTNASQIKNVVAIGDYLFVHCADGKVSAYYRNRSGAFVWYGGLTKNQMLSYTVIVRGAANFNSSQLKTTAKIEAQN